MPKIKREQDFGRHCHNCNVWMPRRALRKELKCDDCGKEIIRRVKCNNYDRCIECDVIILDSFNYCEVCGVETPKGARLNKAIRLSQSFKTSKLSVTTKAAIGEASSSELFPDWNVSSEELSAIEESNETASASASSVNDEHHQVPPEIKPDSISVVDGSEGSDDSSL